jgi:hypothetical protein
MELSMTANRRLCVLATATLITAIVGCGDSGPASGAPPEPRFVRIESKDYSGSFDFLASLFALPEDSIQPWGAVVSDGDIVVGDSDVLFFPYRYSDGDLLRISGDSARLRLNGSVVAADLRDSATVSWLGSTSEAELRALRMIHLPDELGTLALAAVTRLASANPNLHLSVRSLPSLLSTLPLFRPEGLFIDVDVESEHSAVRQLLASQTQLLRLAIMKGDLAGVDIVPTLTSLRWFFADEGDSAKLTAVLKRLPNLQTLLLGTSTDLTGLGFLREAPKTLTELALLTDDLTDLSGVRHTPQLEALTIFPGDATPNLAPLSSLRKLRVLAVSGIGQNQFASLVADHPRLTTFVMFSSDSTVDLAALASLKSLETLVLVGDYTNMEVLRGIRSLRLAEIPRHSAVDSTDQVAALRTALPEATVIAIKPLCLGSGWILLLLPAIATLSYMRRRRLNRALPG